MNRLQFLAVRTVSVALIAVCLTSRAGAQTPDSTAVSADFNRIASRLNAAMRRDGPVRVSIMPIRAASGADAKFAERVPEDLSRALRGFTMRLERAIQIIDAAQVDRALAELGIPTTDAVQPGTALRAGALTSADYVVLAGIVPGDARVPARVNVQLFEVKSGRTVETIAADLTPATPLRPSPAPAVTQPPTTPPPQSAPQRPPDVAKVPASNSTPGHSRAVTLAGGFAFTGVAVGMALQKDRDLRLRKNRIAALPAGATDEWNREWAEAEHVLNARNRWWGLAVAAAGATTSYLVVTEFLNMRRHGPSSQPRLPGAKPTWMIGLLTSAPGVAVVTSF